MTERNRSARHHYNTSRKGLRSRQIKKETLNRRQVQLQTTVAVPITLEWRIYRHLVEVIII